MTGSNFPYASIWQFLEEKGILENGDHEQIQKEKKRYWRAYRKHYQRSYRKSFQEVCVRFTPEEYKTIGVIATALDVTMPIYIRTLTLKEALEIDQAERPSDTLVNISLIQSDIENLIRNHIEQGSDLHEMYNHVLTKVQGLEQRL